MNHTTALSPNIPIHQPVPVSDTPPVERAERKKRGVADGSKHWPPGVVTVGLDLKNEKSKALVVDALQEWAHHTPGLRFEIIDGKQGNIRVSDDEGMNGNWSTIGTDALLEDENLPTLHLERTDDSKQFRVNALHEFGHALGLLHEHQHPQNSLEWDKQAVHDYFVNESFPEELLQGQIFDPVSGSDVQITPYDSQSVMHYPLPPHLTHNRQVVAETFSLSEGDKEAIRRLYTLKIPGVS